jgi:hypothetical protein
MIDVLHDVLLTQHHEHDHERNFVNKNGENCVSNVICILYYTKLIYEIPKEANFLLPCSLYLPQKNFATCVCFSKSIYV